MVSQKSVTAQLKKIGFSQHAWGRAEVRELPNIILPDEEIFECVNGTYEGGFALLVATDIRVLLIDKKPFNYLTVEDLRFDMINEIDYNHRVFGAYVDISTGNRDLKFRSYNQERLRRLIHHVQRRMAEIKRRQDTHQEGQNQHLEQINDRLQAYLIAQYQHQQQLQERLRDAQQLSSTSQNAVAVIPEAPRPSPELSDYLLAQGLLAKHKAQLDAQSSQTAPVSGGVPAEMPGPGARGAPQDNRDDMYADGVREVFGDHPTTTADLEVPSSSSETVQQGGHSHLHLPTPHVSFDINPLKVAYSKLPLAMRNRRFGRPSLQAHNQSEPLVQPQPS
jgi:hypothetical protein